MCTLCVVLWLFRASPGLPRRARHFPDVNVWKEKEAKQGLVFIAFDGSKRVGVCASFLRWIYAWLGLKDSTAISVPTVHQAAIYVLDRKQGCGLVGTTKSSLLPDLPGQLVVAVVAVVAVWCHYVD